MELEMGLQNARSESLPRVERDLSGRGYCVIHFVILSALKAWTVK